MWINNITKTIGGNALHQQEARCNASSRRLRSFRKPATICFSSLFCTFIIYKRGILTFSLAYRCILKHFINVYGATGEVQMKKIGNNKRLRAIPKSRCPGKRQGAGWAWVAGFLCRQCRGCGGCKISTRLGGGGGEVFWTQMRWLSTSESVPTGYSFSNLLCCNAVRDP